MKRAFVYLSALAGIGGVIVLAGGARSQQPGAPAPAPAAAAPQTRPTIAVFNMAAVMRDYGKAKYQVYLLNEKRKALSKDLMAWREDYLKTQQEHARLTDPKLKEPLAQKMLDLARKIEDRDRDINKSLNDDASNIISSLYDDIKMVVDKTAEMNGYHIVFAYPDAVTPEEQKNPFLKELKLKPPAAQPFYVARHVDITGVVVETLNRWYPPVDAQGRPVDVSKLAEAAPVTPQSGAAPRPAAGVPQGVPPGVQPAPRPRP